MAIAALLALNAAQVVQRREIDTRAGRGHGHGTRSSKGRRIA